MSDRNGLHIKTLKKSVYAILPLPFLGILGYSANFYVYPIDEWEEVSMVAICGKGSKGPRYRGLPQLLKDLGLKQPSESEYILRKYKIKIPSNLQSRQLESKS